MWERAPCSCRQELLFMGDLDLSVSPRSCHCTQWVGVVSAMTENKYSSTQTTQPLVSPCASPCDACLADMGSAANCSASFTWAASAPSYFSTIRSLLNVNMFRAGQLGDRETDEGLLKGPVCVCVVFVGWPLGRVPHCLKYPSICLVLPRNLPARCGATSLATPNSSTTTWWSTLTQRSPHFHFT